MIYHSWPQREKKNQHRQRRMMGEALLWTGWSTTFFISETKLSQETQNIFPHSRNPISHNHTTQSAQNIGYLRAISGVIVWLLLTWCERKALQTVSHLDSILEKGYVNAQSTQWWGDRDEAAAAMGPLEMMDGWWWRGQAARRLSDPLVTVCWYVVVQGICNFAYNSMLTSEGSL